MDKLEEIFMLLKSGGIYFLLPVNCVSRVADLRSWKGSLMTALLAGEAGDGVSAQGSGEYLILLEHTGNICSCPDDGTDARGRADFGILADEAAGIVEAGEISEFDLPGEVLSGRNAFLGGAALLEWGGEEVLAFLIAPGRLGFAQQEFWETPETGAEGGNGVDS